jgi:hypothetical protein
MKYEPLEDISIISTPKLMKCYALNNDLNRIFVVDHKIYQVELPSHMLHNYKVVWQLVRNNNYTWWYCITDPELPEGVIKACDIWMKGGYDMPIYEFLNGVFGE